MTRKPYGPRNRLTMSLDLKSPEAEVKKFTPPKKTTRDKGSVHDVRSRFSLTIGKNARGCTGVSK